MSNKTIKKNFKNIFQSVGTVGVLNAHIDKTVKICSRLEGWIHYP